MENKAGNSKVYKIISLVVLVVLALLFLFPLYWIITGAFKPAADIYAQKPVWWPSEWVMTNFGNLMNGRSTCRSAGSLLPAAKASRFLRDLPFRRFSGGC